MRIFLPILAGAALGMEMGMNECAMGTHNCDENASCTDTYYGWACDCNDGWTGSGQECKNVASDCAAGTEHCLYPGTFACNADGRQSFEKDILLQIKTLFLTGLGLLYEICPLSIFSNQTFCAEILTLLKVY